MSLTVVIACWLVGSFLLAPLVGRSIRVSRTGGRKLAVNPAFERMVRDKVVGAA